MLCWLSVHKCRCKFILVIYNNLNDLVTKNTSQQEFDEIKDEQKVLKQFCLYELKVVLLSKSLNITDQELVCCTVEGRKNKLKLLKLPRFSVYKFSRLM